MNETIIASKKEIKNKNSKEFIKVYYKEAILEILNLNKNISKIILYEDTPGKIENEKLIREIKKYNKEIKIEIINKKIEKQNKIGYTDKKINKENNNDFYLKNENKFYIVEDKKELLNKLINEIINKTKNKKILINSNINNKKIYFKKINNNKIVNDNKIKFNKNFDYFIYYSNNLINSNKINFNYLIIKLNKNNIINIIKKLNKIEINSKIIIVKDEDIINNKILEKVISDKIIIFRERKKLKKWIKHMGINGYKNGIKKSEITS